jgi:serine/threonine protein kinase
VSVSSDLEVLLARIVEHHVATGTLLPVNDVVGDRTELAAPLAGLVRQYLAVAEALDGGHASTGSLAGAAAPPGTGSEPGSAPLVIDGFRTIERLGAGGMGEVYKLQDLKLDRIVAGKVIRRRGAQTGLAEFLREAKSLALFSDPRVVRIFEYREAADPPVIIMEYVEGFELGRLGPSLEYRQRAKILREICEAIHHAHSLGIQHRDLKPSNVMLDGRLEPKILDFGLSAGDPAKGHLRGTLHYLAPEQLDPSQPIDVRTDVYALGVILYELLTAVVPYSGAAQDDVIAAIRRGEPRLPVEVDPRVPEPLQAIALKAMERRPADRYPSAREMSLDLGRYLDGLPVSARPSQYGSTLQARVAPHLDQIAEWNRLKLIYPHEAARLQSAYRQLDAREDDWIVASRSLSYSQILLYLGAFLLLAGSFFYFLVHRVHKAVSGLVWPFVVLGVPFLGLNIAGHWLYNREHRAVAVAFYLAGVGLLPLFLLIWFFETGIWVVPAETAGQLFTDGSVSNRQLQVTVLIASLWAGWLALRTQTAALSSVFTLMLLIFALAVLADFGLRDWLEAGEFDRIALRLWPILPAYAGLGQLLERRRSPWFARPLYIAGAVMLLVVLDLLALNGRMFHYLGVSLRSLQSAQVSDPSLLDTVAALTLSGVIFYAVASLVERGGTDVMTPAAQFLFVVAPFSMLEPLAYLCKTGEYSFKVDWLYLAFALIIALLSHKRQRKSFYYAGLVNTGFALYLIALHRQWFDKFGWAAAIVAAGLIALLAGFLFDRFKRQKS